MGPREMFFGTFPYDGYPKGTAWLFVKRWIWSYFDDDVKITFWWWWMVMMRFQIYFQPDCMARLILEEDETSPAAYNHLSIRFFFTFGTPCYERIHVRPQYLKVWVNQNLNTRYNLLQGISGPISFVLHWIYVKPRYLKVWLKLEIKSTARDS